MTKPRPRASGQEKVGGDDLFDVPAEAMSLPGMDAVDSAAAVATFEPADVDGAVDPASAASDGSDRPWLPLRARIGLGAVALGAGVLVALLTPRRAPSPPPAADPTQLSERTEVADPAHAADPKHAADSGHATEPAHVADRSPTPAPHADAHSPSSTVAARTIALPAASRSGRARLQAVESALDAGRRSLARVELGRLLLDVDALPESEREETRAQAELLAARILQDAADEARRSAR